MSLVLKQNPIYKVNLLKNSTTITSIHVFFGADNEEDMNDLFKRDPHNHIFIDKNTKQPIFNTTELDAIIKQNIPVIFSEQQIHYDDSIGVIKLKILAEKINDPIFRKNRFSLDEIYLFCIKNEILNAENIYQTLTQNGRLPLTRTRLEQFILNIIYHENGDPVEFQIPNKEIYTYDDILALDLNGKIFSLTKVLGQKFFIVTNEYPFITNPFQVNEYDEFIERASRKSLTTLNSHLLLNTGTIVGNNIYLCLADDVFAYAQENEISEQYTAKIYYPFLTEKRITSLETLNNNKEKLIDESNKMLNENTTGTFASVDLFYDIYKEKTSNLDYKKIGVKSIKLVIHPLFNIKIPLDVIFKLIHATELSPLIKYNPSQRQENVYRLYADKLATDGRKIPFLESTTIFKLMKTIGKTKSVAVYIPISEKQYIICTFEENGDIRISCDFETIQPIEDLNDLFKQTVNPIILEVKNYLEQSGYNINLYENLLDQNVEVERINYETIIGINKTIKIDDIIGCISSVFIVESKNFKKGIQMRFKRVTNFNKMTSSEAFVIEQVKQKDGLKGSEIITALMENYEMSESDARELLAKLASEVQVERGVRKSNIEIKINPGFPVTIVFNPITSLITINVDNIDDIRYLYVLPIYIDSFIRLTQDKRSTKYPIGAIDSLCGSGEKAEIVMNDIVSTSEAPFLQQEVPIIEGENVEYLDFNKYLENQDETADKPKNALDLFFGDDDYEEENSDSNSNGSFGGKIVGGETPSNSSDDSFNFDTANIQGLDALQSDSSKDNTQSNKGDDLSSFGSENVDSLNLNEANIQGLDALQSDSSKEKEKLSPPSLQDDLSSFGSEKSESPNLPPEEKKSDESIQLNMEEKETLPPPVVNEEKNEEQHPIPIPIPIPQEEVKTVKKKMVKKAQQRFELVEPEKMTQTNVNTVRDIDGQKLSTPNPFQTRLAELEPIIFDNPKQNGKFKSYSRTCLHSARKQPVILTEDEMQNIEKEQPGFMEKGKSNGDILKYGSKPDNQYYYMCPRYWCMKTNSPISEEDAKEGKKCGKIIPRDRKEIRPGEYVFEFFDESEHGTQENYIKHYPGFVEKSKHPDGLCMPCCFKNWDTPAQLERRKQCSSGTQAQAQAQSEEKEVSPSKESISQNKEEKKETVAKDTKDTEKLPIQQEAEKELQEESPKEADAQPKGKPTITKKNIDKEDYIKGPEKFPLEAGRWGYLPMSIQKFLHEVSSDCQVSRTNTNVKPNHQCLLRHGIENNINQSFIACIADVIYFGKLSKVPSISEMKKNIIQSLTLDNFVTYQNGDLVSIFMKEGSMTSIEELGEKYGRTTLYKKVNKRSDKDILFFQNVVSAFENFILYLQDDDIIIDYTYLWDLISRPNKDLFLNGVNLIIMELPNTDPTNNMELICPSNHYSNEVYDSQKQNVLILKNGDYYEPIYAYMNKEEGKKLKLKIEKLFSEHDRQLSPSLKAVFQKLIKPYLKNTCLPLASMPNTYKFKTAISLLELSKLLNKYNYEIQTQVVNYQSKVISVVATNPSGLVGVVPCLPTSINPTYSYVYMSDETMYQTYKNTVLFLKKLNEDSKRKIPCLPAFKVVEDKMIVGILTETNQFIQISEPFPLSEVTDDIKILEENNYLIAEKSIFLSNKEDTERVEYIKKIKLETNFFNVFRNTVRILLNKFDNLSLRDSIETEVKNGGTLYSIKLLTIINYLKTLVGKAIVFSENYDYNMIGDISTCIVFDEDKCNAKKPVCAFAFSTGNTCQLILPKRNLLNKTDNEIQYYGRMADELIRYSRINSFIFQPQIYISFGNLGYNLREDEIIVVQSLLTPDYFEGLAPAEINKYAKYNTYDTAEPIVTQNYENYVNVNTALNPNVENTEEDRECKPQYVKNISSDIWKKCFPTSYGQLVYNDTTTCGFYLILDILRFKGIYELNSIHDVKRKLLMEYDKYYRLDKINLSNILIEGGKKTLGQQLKADTLSLLHFINTDSFFITNFDIWLIMQAYKIPCILISTFKFLETSYENNVFVTYGDVTNDFIFIVTPGFKNQPDNIPSYKVIQGENNEISFSLSVLNAECQETIKEAITNKITIEDFITSVYPTYRKNMLEKPKIHKGEPKKVLTKKNIKLKVVEEAQPVPQEETTVLAVPKETQEIQETQEKEVVEENEREKKQNDASRKNRGRVTITRTRKVPKKVKLVVVDEVVKPTSNENV
jgi:hypothetical protein